MSGKRFFVLCWGVSALWNVGLHAMSQARALRCLTKAGVLSTLCVAATSQSCLSAQQGCCDDRGRTPGACTLGVKPYGERISCMGRLWSSPCTYTGSVSDACELVVQACKGNGSEEEALKALQCAITLKKDVNETNRDGISGLHELQRSSYDCDCYRKAMVLLLNAGADAKSLRFSWGRETLLHSVVGGCKTSLIEPVFRAGIDLNVPDKYGNTPLHAAMPSDNVAGVKELLRLGAHANKKNNDGRTPLMVAAQGCRAAIVKELLAACADSKLRDKEGNTALDIARKQQVWIKSCSESLEALQAHEDKKKHCVCDATIGGMIY